MKPAYPDTRIEEVEEVLAGVSFADPYRWLEAGDSEEVRHWQREQAHLASSYVREWPPFERLQRLVAHFSTGQLTPPRHAGGRWFRTRFAEGASQAQAVVCDEPLGEGRVLFDPAVEHSARPPFLSWISPSPDGRTLALGVCPDGSENNTIRLIDVESGCPLPDPPSQVLMDNWSGGAQWLSDSSGFFFTALAGTATAHEQQVYLHRCTPRPTTAVMPIEWQREYRMVTVSRDGRYAVALERIVDPIPIAIADLTRTPLRWRPFVTSLDGTLAGHIIGDRYIAITDVGASRGRLVAIPLDAANPGDPAGWEVLLGESAAVMRTITPVGDLLYLTELVDTYARVRIVDCAGRARGEVPLPGRGALREQPLPMMNLVPKGHPDEFLFSFSSLTVSPGLYRHVPGRNDIETLQAPRVRLEDAVVEDHWAVSADGTCIPYQLVRRADVCSDVPQPTLVFAYGGFNLALTPKFPGPMAAFVAAGGSLVLAHLRGGGEFGRDWWEGGRWACKQNTYDDLYAIAEDLIAARRSAPALLAVTGDSNGGQTAALAAIQRPDLWQAAIPRVARLDLIGACRHAYGRQSTLEDRVKRLDDAGEVRRLAALSPYHLVRDGVRYPAFYIDAGDTDPRCPPWESRKLAARLQKATASGHPVVLHVWENTGHGLATDRNIAVAQYTEWLAFAFQQLGLWRAEVRRAN